MAVFALEHSGLFNPISMPKNLRRAELAEYRDAIMNEEFVIDPLLTDARTAHHREDMHRMAVERIMDSEGWDIHLVQFIDDGVWYGSMAMPCEEWFGPVPEGEVDECWDSVGPGQLLDIPSTNFSALGLKFSDKESVQGLLKCYGKWRKPLTYLGITYDPASDVLSGPQGVTIKREKLLRILSDQGFDEFQRVVTGMCPGQYSCSPIPEGKSNIEVMLKSPLAKYCQD